MSEEDEAGEESSSIAEDLGAGVKTETLNQRQGLRRWKATLYQFRPTQSGFCCCFSVIVLFLSPHPKFSQALQEVSSVAELARVLLRRLLALPLISVSHGAPLACCQP